MIDRVLKSMVHWYRLVGGASDGAWIFERDGVVGVVVPAAPERAVVNAVLYRDPEGLEAAYDELACAYAEIGAKWTVWVPPGDEAAAQLLESRGHVLDGQPMAMATELAGVTRPPADGLSDWTARGSLAEVGEVNDRANTFETDSFSRSLQSFPEGAANIYVVREDGQAIGCLVTVDKDGNSEVQMVAVLPEARGRGTTRKLLGYALADAAERGNETSTLIATPLGHPVYEGAGFRPLERFSMWEFRQAPRSPRT